MAWNGNTRRVAGPMSMSTPTDATNPKTPSVERRVDTDVGSPEHLRSSFARAAAAADRAVGLRLARSSGSRRSDDRASSPVDQATDDLTALRAQVRVSATAYARRLREDGEPPERMLVLIKGAAGHPGTPGIGARELTNDIVRWSIEAYFND